MRSILFWTSLLILLHGVPDGRAERAASRIILFNEEDEFIWNVPLLYSYEEGQWVTSRPGNISASGRQKADFILPILKGTPRPIKYPRWALERNWQGELVVAVEILQDGGVGRWKVMRSTGYELLDEAAVRAIREWRFEPAREGGEPIVSCIQIPIQFKIEAT